MIEGLAEAVSIPVRSRGATVFLFLSSYVENLFPPAPGDTFTVIGAFLVGRGQLSFFPAYLSTLLGSVCGFHDMLRDRQKVGKGVVQREDGAGFSRANIWSRVERWFGRYGIGCSCSTVSCRDSGPWCPSPPEWRGWTHGRCFFLALFSCAAWNGLLMGWACWAGGHWARIVRNYERVMLGAIAGLLLFWWVRSVIRKRQEKIVRVAGFEFRVKNGHDGQGVDRNL